MTAEKKLTQQRLSLLELAEALGSVLEACRQRGVSRTRFYEYKRRFQTHGLEGLKDLPPIAKSHPMTTPAAVVDTFSSYAFALLATSKKPETAALLLHNDVLPFYREKRLPVSALLTDNGREFCGATKAWSWSWSDRGGWPARLRR